MITLTINGKQIPFPSPLSLLDLLKELDINPAHKLIEVRNTIYNHDEFDSVMAQDGDVIEIIQFMGGGQN